MQDISAIIDTLNLQPHPEGGFYKEMYRSGNMVQCLSSSKAKTAHTSIYYLLSGKDFSSWHRIKSDETWYFHLGCDLHIYFFDKNKVLQTGQLGLQSKKFQLTIPADTWFAAKPLNENAFCLVSCAVAPGFEFNDFEIARRDDLLAELGGSAENNEIIVALTRL